MSRTLRGKRAILWITIVLAVIVLLPQIRAYGATPPEFTRLLTIGVSEIPGRITADNAGNVYVADIYYSVVKIYSPKGVFRGSIRLAYKPVSIAVSPDNYLYVGERKFESTGYLEVFRLDGQRVTARDVKTPVSMAFLSNGDRYELNGYFVKRYDSNMSVVSQFGGYGTGNGSLIDPMSIAINETKGEIYVLDKGAIATEGSYTDTNVWRVQVFDLATGAYLRQFSNYGYGVDGKIGSASSIAVDKQGRVYISDNVQGIVMVYDENGVYLNVLYDSAQPISNPVNLHFRNDRLYIVSTFGLYATVFGVDGYAELRAEPLSVAMTYQQGLAAPSKDIAIYNDGRGPLTWQASADASWLVLSQSSGEVAGGGSQGLTVTINPEGLTVGTTYAGNISITSNGGTETVSVSLEVTAPPVLTVTPSEITIQKKTGEAVTPKDVTVTITNDRSGTLIWQAAADAGWVSMTPKTGLGSGMSQITINQDAAGKYTGTITVTAEGATGSPATITVNLEVISSGKINVVTNTADATYTITGPGVSYSGSGMAYTVSDVPEGDYTITFNPVQGYKIPVSMTQSVVPGSEITFTGQYTDMRRQMNIIASRSLGSAGLIHNSDVAVFRADGTMALSFRAFPLIAGASTAAGDIDGDGQTDIIVGGFASPANKIRTAEVKGFKKDATEQAGSDFRVADSKFGVTLAAGDFDGDGKDEIVTGDSKTTTNVRVYTYDGTMVYDTGLNFAAYPGTASGVEVVAADVDGDGVAEIITIPERGDAIPEVRIYRVNTAGSWTAELIGSFNACSMISAAEVTAGDIDGDGIAEIITTCAAEKTVKRTCVDSVVKTRTTTTCTTTNGSVVKAYRITGELLRSFDAGATNIGSLAAGDTDMDGKAEIITGESPTGRMSTVKVFNAEGALLNSFEAFADSFGVRVSVGNLGY